MHWSMKSLINPVDLFDVNGGYCCVSHPFALLGKLWTLGKGTQGCRVKGPVLEEGCDFQHRKCPKSQSHASTHGHASFDIIEVIWFYLNAIKIWLKLSKAIYCSDSSQMLFVKPYFFWGSNWIFNLMVQFIDYCIFKTEVLLHTCRCDPVQKQRLDGLWTIILIIVSRLSYYHVFIQNVKTQYFIASFHTTDWNLFILALCWIVFLFHSL